MRRYKKKELLETADMLVEANEVIGRLCKSSAERALEIFGQCQESAILLGNLIESKGDGYTELIEILENYCENIYQMSIAVSDEEQIRKLSKKIQKQLTYLNNKIRQEIPEDKKEVVFFPYKASMWDSLESVWMAADADEDTDAYVVPIPYYDKNPDGTFREMHYEGEQYPDYVPITNWEEYEFEERRPDVMFIHNPYDQYNYVTSVHPRFYSKNLKKFTEKLVYIPYFILGEIDPEDDIAIERMKHFCINEAVNNADKVIVQSEDMRQVYIKVLTEESGGSKEARAYWEKKIDGSGSPKVDKVLRTKKEDLEIPEEWMKIIRKPDGSFKKIVFYNTSVTALLQHDEQMLTKMRDVFQIFREKRDEVTLLWRPHPLIKATLESMRSQLCIEYDELVRKYKEEGWGIYDDTSDVDRAVVLSDAYYGDPSSVVRLCIECDKMVMLQNVNAINTKERQSKGITCLGIYKDGTELWLPSKEFNALFKMDLLNGTVKYIGKFPDCISENAWIIWKMLRHEGEVYFFSRTAYQVWKYNNEKNVIETCASYSSGDTVWLNGIAFVGNDVWFIPNRLNKPIIYYNFKTQMMNPLVWDNHTFLNCGTNGFTEPVVFQKNIYFMTRKWGEVYLCRINCVQKQISLTLMKDLYMVSCIGEYRNKLYVVGKNERNVNMIRVYQIKTMEWVEDINLSQMEDIQREYRIYFQIVFSDENILLIPERTKNILGYQTKEKREYNVSIPPDFQVLNDEPYVYSDIQELESQLYMVSYHFSQIFRLNLIEQTACVIDILVTSSEYRKAFEKLTEEKGFRVEEDRVMNLYTYIDLICTLHGKEIIK